jgi:hypothetical protein
MSSSSPSPTNTSTTSPTPTSQGGGPSKASANYFFGFLIGFVVIVFLLLSFGYGSNRLTQRRRAMLGLNADGTRRNNGDSSRDSSPPKPTHWEGWLRAADGVGEWGNMMVSQKPCHLEGYLYKKISPFTTAHISFVHPLQLSILEAILCTAAPRKYAP